VFFEYSDEAWSVTPNDLHSDLVFYCYTPTVSPLVSESRNNFANVESNVERFYYPSCFLIYLFCRDSTLSRRFLIRLWFYCCIFMINT
jgi:hypothetical protein